MTRDGLLAFLTEENFPETVHNTRVLLSISRAFVAIQQHMLQPVIDHAALSSVNSDRDRCSLDAARALDGTLDALISLCCELWPEGGN
jgi:hypothetical protein